MNMMPRDIGAERIILGLMLSDVQSWETVIRILGEDGGSVFLDRRHRQLYQILSEAEAFGFGADRAALMACHSETIGKIGGPEFLEQLMAAIPEEANAEDHARSICNLAALRGLLREISTIRRHARQRLLDPEQILDHAESSILSIAGSRCPNTAASLHEVAGRLVAKGSGGSMGILTGLVSVDEILGGAGPGELIVVAGRPSMGKSAFGLQMAEFLACKREMPVAYFSLEMSASQCAARILYGQCGIRRDANATGRLTQDQQSLLEATVTRLESTPLFFDDSASLTIAALRVKARMLKRSRNIQALFVDYLQLMHAPHVRQSRSLELAAISGQLKTIARELAIPVFALAQLNRGPSDRLDHRPRLSDLRESCAIEQDADVVVLLHRPGYYGDKCDDSAEIIVAKQRNGPVGIAKLQFDAARTRFAENEVC